MKKSGKRFCIVDSENDLSMIERVLEKLTYDKLDPAIDHDAVSDIFIFIDNYKNHFWFLDRDSLEQTMHLVETHYGDHCYYIGPTEILQNGDGI